MQSNTHLVLGLIVLVFVVLGAIPFLSMKSLGVRKAGLLVATFGTVFGLVLVTIGLYDITVIKRSEMKVKQDVTQFETNDTTLIQTNR